MQKRPVIDADRHVIEPIDAWMAFLDPAFRQEAPYLVEEGDVPFWTLPLLRGAPLQNRYSATARAEVAAVQRTIKYFGSPEDHLRHMDQYGIEASVLLPTIAHYVLAVDEMPDALAAAFARAYNDWLFAFVSAAPARLRGAAVLPLHDPALALTEARRCADRGWTAIVVRPNPVRGRLLGHPDYAMLWQWCEENSIAVVCHEGTHARLPTAGADRFETRFAQHACSHPMEMMMAFLSLLESGVLERHPRLRVGFLEAGAGWVPYWMWRLDEEHRQMKGEVAHTVRMPPSHYFRRQCYVALEPGEPYLQDILRYVGPDNLLFGTDFPHPDHEEGVAYDMFALATSLGEETVQKIFRDNPQRFYRL